MTADLSIGPYPHLIFTVDAPLVPQFFLLLQQGVKIRRRVGCSVDVFLRQEMGASAEMIEKIQSIILEGKPVDDISSALIHNGSILALSAAMPGLVGATLRRGGAYSSFRSAITYHETERACAAGEGWVGIKLFNLLMAELGPDLLRNGVLVTAQVLSDFLSERYSDIRPGCRRITLDGKPIDISMVARGASLGGKDEVFLTVEVGTINT